MNDEWTQKLSDYLDDELSADGRAEVEERLAEEEQLRRVLEELRAVKERAAALRDRPPATDLWPGIAARIADSVPMAGAERRRDRDAGAVKLLRRRRVSFNVPQLIAASVALVLLGSASVWLAVELGGPVAQPASDVPAGAPAVRAASASAASGSSYDAAIRDLEQRLEAGQFVLDTTTARIIEESLATIDRAIERARRALDADPANIYLNQHLADAQARKLRLLRRASVLVSRS